MAEKIERMELESESKEKVHFIKINPLVLSDLGFRGQANYSFFTFVQQITELQELYNSQQLLTADLSEKLEKTEVLQFWMVNLQMSY